MRLVELAERLGAVLDLGSAGGDGSAEIGGVAGLEQARAGQVTFVANPRYAALARMTGASAVIVEPGFGAISVPTLRVREPYLAFARAIEMFYEAPVYGAGIHSTAVIAASARVGARAHVGAYAVIGERCVVGDDAVIHPHVVLYEGVTVGSGFVAHAHAVVREHCLIGDRVVLQNGVVLGGDGFGFARRAKEDGEPGWHKIVQSGRTVIEDDVEVQANACIDRASVGETRVKRGAKVDNLVQVGHGSTVGENTLLCAQVGLAGSSEVGRNVILAGQVGVAGHCVIGDGVVATAQSGIPNDVPAGKMVSGYPAVENRQWLRSVAVFNRLPEILRELRGRR